jgi:hypothetical protein
MCIAEDASGNADLFGRQHTKYYEADTQLVSKFIGKLCAQTTTAAVVRGARSVVTEAVRDDPTICLSDKRMEELQDAAIIAMTQSLKVVGTIVSHMNGSVFYAKYRQALAGSVVSFRDTTVFHTLCALFSLLFFLWFSINVQVFKGFQVSIDTGYVSLISLLVTAICGFFSDFGLLKHWFLRLFRIRC